MGTRCSQVHGRGVIAVWALAVASAGSPAEEPTLEELQRAALESYADLAFDQYSRCANHARTVRAAVGELTAAPSDETLAAARSAWLEARREYGRTEVFRFYGGPIDDAATGVETFLNAWPLDEAYIDYVADAPAAGIINDPAGYPNLDETILVLLNERGGEANVSIGWHAVEFLLWGQDLDPDGPGRRPYTDYVPDEAPHARRRALYLELCADLLVEHHESLRSAWQPGSDNYRANLLAARPADGLRKVLAGMTILSGFEMAGERLAVAYETQDQEEEH